MMAAATVWTGLPVMTSLPRTYRMVVDGEAWPSAVATLRTSAPASTPLVAKVCRRVCGCSPGMPAWSPSRPSRRCAARGSIAAPVLVANSGPGWLPRRASQSLMATTAGAGRTAVRGLPPLPVTRRTVAPCWVSRSASWRVRASPIRRPHSSRTATRARSRGPAGGRFPEPAGLGVVEGAGVGVVAVQPRYLVRLGRRHGDAFGGGVPVEGQHRGELAAPGRHRLAGRGEVGQPRGGHSGGDRRRVDAPAGEPRGELPQVTGIGAGGVRGHGAQPAGQAERGETVGRGRPDGQDIGAGGHDRQRARRHRHPGGGQWAA